MELNEINSTQNQTWAYIIPWKTQDKYLKEKLRGKQVEKIVNIFDEEQKKARKLQGNNVGSKNKQKMARETNLKEKLRGKQVEEKSWMFVIKNRWRQGKLQGIM